MCIRDSIHSNEYHLLRQSDIQKEMKQVVENLHMAAGSVGGFDLYKVCLLYTSKSLTNTAKV